MEEVESPLTCIDKADDICSFYRRTEIKSCAPADYMLNQTAIIPRLRALLVDLIIEVHNFLKLRRETLFLAINLIDRYLSHHKNIMIKTMLLVGFTGIFLASKYEDSGGPDLQQFVDISDGQCTRYDILEMELSMLKALQYRLTVPSPLVFLRRFLEAIESETKVINMEKLCSYLLELSLVEYQMLKFPPSLQSAAAIYTGRYFLRKSPPWNKTLESHSSYSEEELKECAGLMVKLHQNANQGMLTSVYKKFYKSNQNRVGNGFEPVEKIDKDSLSLQEATLNQHDAIANPSPVDSDPSSISPVELVEDKETDQDSLSLQEATPNQHDAIANPSPVHSDLSSMSPAIPRLSNFINTWLLPIYIHIIRSLLFLMSRLKRNPFQRSRTEEFEDVSDCGSSSLGSEENE